MSAKFYTLLTEIGAAKLASAAALGIPLKITQMAVGDGGGVLPTPSAQQTALVAEKHRAALNMLYIDPQNSSQIIAEQVIPETEGGWWIREVGLFDETGALIAVGNCPESYKPQLAEGSGRTQTVRMVLITSSTDNITLKIDPAVVLATRKYVDDKVLELKVYVDDLMARHLAAADPHTQYAPKASPTFTGTPKAPTAAAGNNSTQLANTAFVQAAIAALVASSPAALDTLNELAAALGNDPNFAATMTNALAGKMDKAANGTDIADVSEFLKNLGLVNNGAVGRLIGMQIIKTSGTYTKTPGAMFADVIAIGGGGGGGWATSTASYNAAGGGGGGGGMARGLFNLSAISTVLVTIGAGGNGGIASTITNGAQGGTTTFGSYLSAGGGQPGNGCTASGSSASCGMGGQGGTSTVGALLCNGYAGLPGVMATPTAVGGTVGSGLGGGSFISGPGGYGAGGNGAATSGGAQNVNGNPGNAGVIIILEYA
ncbi:phage tail protein [Escherichia O88:H52]